jgi:hypothetical protein
MYCLQCPRLLPTNPRLFLRNRCLSPKPTHPPILPPFPLIYSHIFLSITSRSVYHLQIPSYSTYPSLLTHSQDYYPHISVHYPIIPLYLNLPLLYTYTCLLPTYLGLLPPYSSLLPSYPPPLLTRPHLYPHMPVYYIQMYVYYPHIPVYYLHIPADKVHTRSWWRSGGYSPRPRSRGSLGTDPRSSAPRRPAGRGGRDRRRVRRPAGGSPPRESRPGRGRCPGSGCRPPCDLAGKGRT